MGVPASQGSQPLSDTSFLVVPCSHPRDCRGSGPQREGSVWAYFPVIQLTSPTGHMAQSRVRAPLQAQESKDIKNFSQRSSGCRGFKHRALDPSPCPCKGEC